MKSNIPTPGQLRIKKLKKHAKYALIESFRAMNHKRVWSQNADGSWSSRERLPAYKYPEEALT